MGHSDSAEELARGERRGEARKENNICWTPRMFNTSVLLAWRVPCRPYLIESPQLCKGDFIIPISCRKKLGLRESGNLPQFTHIISSIPGI